MMTARCIVLFVVLWLAASTCRADIIILMNGERYRGELNYRTRIMVNPLSLDAISILLEAGGTPEEKFVSFDARDIRTIIVEMEGARQIIELEELRKIRFESATGSGQHEEARPEAVPEPAAGTQVGEAAVSSDGGTADRGGVGSTRTKRSLWLIGGGVVAVGVGAAAEFGNDDGLNALNYAFIGIGLALVTYGVVREAVNPRLSGPGTRLGVCGDGTVRVSIGGRF